MYDSIFVTSSRRHTKPGNVAKDGICICIGLAILPENSGGREVPDCDVSCAPVIAIENICHAVPGIPQTASARHVMKKTDP